ncbi:MAG: CoA transferase, partial [Deltaproteobacteria bacterium]|nr:CoA transferase [Deltaproteobacteria bacterium]
MAGPLEGIRVIDLTSMVSGPMATCVLGDQGAEVVKVEIPGTGDLIRHIGCARGGLSAIFTTLNRNKRSIVLNLRQPHGRELLHKLLAGADVLVQNFRPGVMDALGFGEAELRPRYPDLVYVSISGFG